MSGLVVRHIVDCDTDPLTPSGCSVEEHKKDGQLLLDIPKVKLVLSLSQMSDEIIRGDKLREELMSNSIPILNANVLDYLHQNQKLIPEDWRYHPSGHVRRISFWGTVYRHLSSKHLFIRTLCWNGNTWDWGYCWLHFNCSNRHFAAILAN